MATQNEIIKIAKLVGILQELYDEEGIELRERPANEDGARYQELDLFRSCDYSSDIDSISVLIQLVNGTYKVSVN